MSRLVVIYLIIFFKFGLNAKRHEDPPKYDAPSMVYYKTELISVNKKDTVVRAIIGSTISYATENNSSLNIFPTGPTKSIRDELAELGNGIEKTFSLLDSINGCKSITADDPENYGNSDYNFLERYASASSPFTHPFSYDFTTYGTSGNGESTTQEGTTQPLIPDNIYK